MQSGTRLPFCCSKMNWWMISAGQKQHENKHGWTQNTTPVRCLCYSYQIRWITKLWLYYRLLGSTCHLAPTAKVKEAIKHDLKQPAVVLDVRTTRYVKNSCGHANNPIQFMIRRQSHVTSVLPCTQKYTHMCTQTNPDECHKQAWRSPQIISPPDRKACAADTPHFLFVAGGAGRLEKPLIYNCVFQGKWS